MTTMTMTVVVFRAMMALGLGLGRQEPLPVAWERLHDVSQVIAEVSLQTPDPWRTARLLLVVGYHESRFSAEVGAGGCSRVTSGSWCDGGRARSYWQLWQVSCPELWELPAGSRESTRQAAECASRHLWGGYRACKKRGLDQESAWIGAISRYAVGHGCYWSGAEARMATLGRVALLQETGR